MAQELVAQPLAAAGALDQAGDIDKLDRGRRHLLRMVHFRQYVQPVVRHHHNTRIGFNRAERIILRLGACVRNCVEQSALSDVWQSYNSKFHFVFALLPSVRKRPPRQPYRLNIIMMRLLCVKLSKSVFL